MEPPEIQASVCRPIIVLLHVESRCMASNAKNVSTISGGRKCCGECCSLCKGHLGRSHSHPEQWNGELQQFLLQYTDIPDPLHACVCKADELSIRKGLSGKCKGDFTPRWLKREKNKMKLCCVVVSQATPFAEGGRVWSRCNYTELLPRNAIIDHCG